jgi:hypothetical protein
MMSQEKTQPSETALLTASPLLSNVELAVDAGQVALDDRIREVQGVYYLLVDHAAGRHTEDLQLSRGELALHGLLRIEVFPGHGDGDVVRISRRYVVIAGLVDGSRSRVFDQAENRLHAQKALHCLLLCC